MHELQCYPLYTYLGIPTCVVSDHSWLCHSDMELQVFSKHRKCFLDRRQTVTRFAVVVHILEGLLCAVSCNRRTQLAVTIPYKNLVNTKAKQGAHVHSGFTIAKETLSSDVHSLTKSARSFWKIWTEGFFGWREPRMSMNDLLATQALSKLELSSKQPTDIRCIWVPLYSSQELARGGAVTYFCGVTC